MSPETVSGPTPLTARPGDAFCFHLKEERSGWNVLLPVPGKNQIDVTTLLRDAPEFLSMDDTGAICRVAVPLFEHGDARVLAALDEAGGVCLVGYPVQVTREVVTTVAREILVLSGRLWRMPLEEFTAMLEKGPGRTLGELFAGKTPKDWAEATFRAGLRRSLEQGRFPVKVLLPSSNKDAVEVLSYLRQCNVAVTPVSVESYESWGVEIVVPKVLSIPELGSHEGTERVQSVHRPSPPPRTPPPRFQTSQAGVAQIGRPEPEPQASPEWKPTPNPERPWASQPAPKPVVEVESPRTESRPTPAAPALKPAPAEKTVWDGTMPGVMAGKRPPPRSPDEPPRKGQDQSKGRR